MAEGFPMDPAQLALELQGLESRSRSSTWPCQDDENGSRDHSESPVPTVLNTSTKSEPPKKMRNAWGNLSYADLITQAILSSPDKRLTLSEIYDWIVHNIPYFSDKASSPSTAGWKNSVRHNLSLHSRFVKVQNESSGKSSWWTVNLDAKNTRGRRRSSSVDNGNAPSPRSKKKERKKQLKKIKGTGSSTDLQTSSPCDSPTATTGFLQPPWSPSPHIDCPSPASSDRSATYSPVAFSPVLQRHSRNATPVSPLVSPPALEHENVFSGSNSSLLDSFQDSNMSGGLIGSDITDPMSQQCIESMASLNLRSSRDGLGSSSSLSSLNSPRLQQLKATHVFNFSSLPATGTIDGSSGYSSVSDTDQAMHTEVHQGPIAPPPYDDHLPNSSGNSLRPVNCSTPTRHTSFGASHQLHFSLAYEGRPRSGSEPAPHLHMNHHFPRPHHHIPRDLDPSLFTADFKDLNIHDVIQQELQYGGGLDFTMAASDGTYSSLNPRTHHSPHHSHLCPPPLTNDPTLTSVALDSPLQVHRQINPGW